MAVINKNSAYMDFPLQIARQYGAPIEKYEVFYSLEEAKTYASTSPIAYVGQVVAVVNEADNTTDIYVITNKTGNMQQLGAASDVSDLSGDVAKLKEFQRTHTAEYNTLSESVATLKGTTDNLVGLCIVADETHSGFITATDFVKLQGIAAGAEVNKINGVKVNNQALSPDSQKYVNIDLSSYATKNELSAIPKFKIQVVKELPSVGESATIYLVPNTPVQPAQAKEVATSDSYSEYIYAEKQWEKIGDTSVALKNYFTKKETTAAIETAKGEAVSAANAHTDTAVQNLKTEIEASHPNTEETNTLISDAIQASEEKTTTAINKAKQEAITQADANAAAKDALILQQAKEYTDAKDVGVTEIVCGSGLTGGTINSTGTIALEAIDAINTNNTGRKVVQNVVTDGHGRVTNVTSVDLPDDSNTWRPVNLNGTVFLTNDPSEHNNALSFADGTGTTVVGENGTIKINAAEYTGSHSIQVSNRQISLLKANISTFEQNSGDMLILDCGKAQ